MDAGDPMNLFCFGYGFSSSKTADFLRFSLDQTQVFGTVRTEEKATRLRADGITAHLFDGKAPGLTLGDDLRAATHVVLSIAPGEHGDPALVHHRADLDAAKNLQWLCYYSTVGVYGDFGGAWIDESAPLVPRNDRSDRRVLAEQAWRDYAAERGVPLTILRLAGIYGPGRSTFDAAGRHVAADRQAGPGVQPHPCRRYWPGDRAGCLGAARRHIQPGR
jgi:nucleoside-diphosphate-sugar epimerase